MDITPEKQRGQNYSLNWEEFCGEVAALVRTDDITHEDNLIELGLSSMSLMRLNGRLRKSGIKVTFAQLIEEPTLTAWKHLLFAGEEDSGGGAENSEGRKAEDAAVLASTEPFSLTDVQYAYWLGRKEHQVLGGIGCHAYIELDGSAVEPERLKCAWEKIIQRHDMLRARISEDGEQWVGEYQAGRNPFCVHDLRNASLEMAEAEVERIRNRLSHRQFKIAQGEVAGLELTLLPEQRTRLHFDIDLLVADVHSFQLILSDLAEYYLHNMDKRELNWSFADYLEKNRRGRESERAKAEVYWRNRIAKMPLGPELPLAKKAEDIGKPIFKARRKQIDAARWELIKEKAGAYQVTPAMVLLTVYSQVLGRFSQNDRFLINIPLFGRQTYGEHVDEVVADFTNLILFEADQRGNDSFINQVRKVRERFYRDIEHSAYSGVEVQREIARYHKSRALIAPVVFACNLDTELVTDSVETAFGSLHYIISQTPQVYLDFQVYEVKGALLLKWDAVEELFPEGLLDEMLEYLEEILNELVIHSWEEETAINTDSLAGRFDGDIYEVKNHGGLLTPILEYGSVHAHKPALIDAKYNRVVSYGDLIKMTAAVGSFLLQETGIKAGCTVGISLPRGVEQIAAVLGVLYAGGAYVPISLDQPDVRRKKMQNSAALSGVITDSGNKARIQETDGCQVLDIGSLLEYRNVEDPFPIDERSLAYIIFTSGTTGEPKGVQITHQSAWNTIESVLKRYRISQTDKILGISAVDFDLSVFDIFGILSAGGSYLIVPDEKRRDPEWWLKVMKEHKVTVWNSVPVLFDMLLTAAEGMGERIPDLERVLLSGDWIGLDIPERMERSCRKASLTALGGATEAAIWSNYYDVTLPLPPHWVSIPYGYPLPNQSYRIVDRKNRDCPVWTAGELYIGGTGVAEGYCDAPVFTAEKFVEMNGERWYRTGDKGRSWPDGTIEFLGRLDSQVKIRGHRIEVLEIESALKEYSGICDAAVAAEDHGDGNKILAAYLVFERDSKEVDEKRLKEHIADILPAYMHPRKYCIIKEMPISSNGKIDKKALQRGEFKSLAEVRARKEEELSPAAASIWKIWCEVLEVSPLERRTDFFELGGDSLSAVKVVNEIRKLGTVSVSLDDIFNNSQFDIFVSRLEAGDKKIENGIGVQKQLKSDRKSIHVPFPLNPIQQSYWIGRKDIYALGGVSTHFYYEMECPMLDLKRLEMALQRLLDRHDMMRAVVLADGMHQQVLEQVPYYNISCIYGDEQKRLEIRDVMTTRQFDETRWPLFEIRATVRQDGNMHLHLVFDNIIFDGWSVSLLLGQWYQLYMNPELPLHDLEIGFRDYVLYLEDIKASDRYTADRLYWHQRIQDMAPAPQLPQKCRPGQVTNSVFAHKETVVVSEVWEAIKKWARQEKITPTVLLLTVYAEILARWSTDDNFTINVTMFNRLPLHPQVNELVGDFTALNPISAAGGREVTFRDMARGIQQQMLAHMEHPYYSGVEVLRDYAKANHITDGQIMPVVFTSALGFSDESKSLEGFGKRVYGCSQTPQVWLDLQVMESGAGLVITLDYRQELFPDQMVDQMFEAYYKRLEQFKELEDAGAVIYGSQLPLPVDKRQQANQTDFLQPQVTLYELFQRSYLTYKDRIAVTGHDGSLTYQELKNISDVIAARLLDAGLKVKDHVAVIMEKGWEQIAAVLGILRAGGVYIPIDARYPRERIELLISNSKAAYGLVQNRFAKCIGDMEGCTILSVNEMDKQTGPPHKYPCAAAGDPAYIIYTSGTSGTPKGVVISHTGAVNTILDINRRFHITEKDAVLSLSNLNFDLSVYDIFGMLAAGGCIVLPDPQRRQDPFHWQDLIGRHSVSVWNTVPAYMQILSEITGTWLCDEMRLVMLSGDWIPLALPGRIRAAFPAAKVVGLGGATECSIWSNYYEIEELDPAWKSIPYGKPLANQRFYVLNSRMEDRPDWVPGTLYIGGLGLAQGYWDDIPKTNQKFVVHPKTGERLYDTGDLGRYFPDGNIEFLGRGDNQVKVNGYRIELEEIEVVLKQHPGIQKAVAAVRSNNGSSRLAAAVQLNETGKKEFYGKAEHIAPNLLAPNTAEELFLSAETEVKEEEVRYYRQRLEQAVIRTMIDVLTLMGVYQSEKLSYTKEELMAAAGIKKRYRPVIDNWLDTLTGSGFLEEYSGELRSQGPVYQWECSVCVPECRLVSSGIRKLCDDMERRLLRSSVSLQQVLQGKMEAISLYFIKDGLTPRRLQEYDFSKEAAEGLIENIVQEYAEKAGTLEILELGTRVEPLFFRLEEQIRTAQWDYSYADEIWMYGDEISDELSPYIKWEKTVVPNEEQSYDIVLANNVLHRYDDRAAMLTRIKKVLKPGGLLVFSEMTEQNPLVSNILSIFQEGPAGAENERREWNEPLWNTSKWLQLCSDCGFENVYAGGEKYQNAALNCRVFLASRPVDHRIFEVQQVIDYLGGKLPEYMIPQDILVRDEIPLTANGKVDRKVFAEERRKEAPRAQRAIIMPVTDQERAVHDIWAGILHCDEFGVDDKFFELGGDSLKAIQCVSEMKQQLNITVTLHDLYNHQTVRAIADLVSEEQSEFGEI